MIRELGYLALGTRLRRLGERLQAETQRILDDHGLAIQAAQFPLLAAIDRLGPSTIGELAGAIGVSQPAATRAVGLLVEAELVASAIDRDDLRCRRVELAPRGRGLVDAGKRVVWPAIDAAVRDLCARRSGPLLDQLAAIEDGLAEVPLVRRAAPAPRGNRAAATTARTAAPATRLKPRRAARRPGAQAR
ncbi:MAG TPA: MarR family transcriptional regulator [Kofleriaceae bacterium]|nr:MarR family transcriptional regulator [Kofleriaceae bacterium]